MTPDTQAVIENAIHTLVTEFREDPYRFFTEADAVARFHQILETDLTVDQNLVTLDGYKTSTLHQKYPTFFRFDDKNPIARLDPDSRASRGHYDIVILNERFVRTHDVETVKNRDFRSIRDTSVPPLQAVVEFKLDDRGWSNGKRKGAIAELGKLILSREEVELRYFVVLMRYTRTSERAWNKHWPDIMQSATKNFEIKSIFATHRVQTKFTDVQSFGDWLAKYEEM